MQNTVRSGGNPMSGCCHSPAEEERIVVLRRIKTPAACLSRCNYLKHSIVYFGSRRNIQMPQVAANQVFIHLNSLCAAHLAIWSPSGGQIDLRIFIRPNLSNFWPLEFESLSTIFQVSR
jgi:hypothetical protein